MFTKGLKLLWTEGLKMMPLIIFILAVAWYLKDFAQIELALYFMAVLALNMLFFQVVRKFLFPSFSVESHMSSAWHGNMASALLVCAVFMFMLSLCFMSTWFMMAHATKGLA